MTFLNGRARRLAALLAAACAAAAALWIAGGQTHALAAGPPAAAHHAAARDAKARARARAKVKHHAKHHAKAKAKHHKKAKAKHHAKPKAKPKANPGPPPPQKTPKAGPPPIGLSSGSYTNGAGTLSYELYVPTNYHAGTPMPLVVALHGCGQSADSYRQLSGWDTYAQSHGFIVVFPQQSSSRNTFTCWNWFVQADMQRGSGEPAIIAGMVGSTEHSYSVDSHRVYVAGFSAGAAMANVMGATYPDMFAAVGSGSGCEYNGLPCVGGPGPAPSQTGQQAYQAMGSHARVMPAIVFQGASDSTVDPRNGPMIVQEWQITDNYVLSGSANGPIPTNPSGSSFGVSGGNVFYQTTNYPDNHGNQLIQYVSVQSMNHAWSGGSSSQQYSDPSGPSETAMMYAFFASHPLP